MYRINTLYELVRYKLQNCSSPEKYLLTDLRAMYSATHSKTVYLLRRKVAHGWI